ncbi:putative histidine kinase [Saccharothrix espanaensis DSM 44229]|uniref:histidine kinase n=1 Tax=Saccharothrix espanaensis (strain ATCC 51144 / DSM 44229 / JCM 9112 / NBRC 15066 / NRRL 15764) TaxID=1179773 RepID=K0JQK1_SACES|nr:putative histidine kinase [Saccharothrix espanaensis DSM 44229]
MSIVDGLRRQWPVALGLTALLVVQFAWLLPFTGLEFVTWLATVPTCAAALVAFRWPVVATAVAAGSVLTTTVVGASGGVRLDAVLSPLSVVETVACCALVVAVVRFATPRAAAGCVAVLMAVAAIAAVARDGYSFVDTNIVGSLLIGSLAVGAGWFLRTRDAERAVRMASAVADAQREERMALARELHDVVAHHLTGMLVQAQAAWEVSDDDPRAAHRLLPGIVTGGTEAMGAMRTLVGTLRQGDAETATTDLEADVLAAVDRVRQTGTPVRLRYDLPADLPPEVGRSLLRLVQEALTNARRHAVAATGVDVELTLGPDVVRLVVSDDGEGGAARREGGYGLVGMRERVGLLGGRFTAGPVAGGWRVSAELPWAGRR